MCLAVPAKIVELRGETATISVDGALRDVNVSLVDEPRLGEYVLVHAGFALQKWDQTEYDEWREIQAAASP
jgi:hydrogenase expression/formation protein HypC